MIIFSSYLSGLPPDFLKSLNKKEVPTPRSSVAKSELL